MIDEAGEEVTGSNPVAATKPNQSTPSGQTTWMPSVSDVISDIGAWDLLAWTTESGSFAEKSAGTGKRVGLYWTEDRTPRFELAFSLGSLHISRRCQLRSVFASFTTD